MKLRDYQIELVNLIRDYILKKITRIVCQLFTGGGKTIIFSYIVKQATTKNKRCLILTNRIELLEQAGGIFQKFNIEYENITPRLKVVPRLPVAVAMIETLNNRLKNRLDFVMWFKTIDVIIIDECFVAGTKVSGKNIEEIKPGDYVDSFNHSKNVIEKKKVLCTSKKYNNKRIYIIKTLRATIECTEKHPIFVKGKGYVESKNLKIGDIVYVRPCFKLQRYFSNVLQTLWKRNKYRTTWEKKVFIKKIKFSKIRLHFLFKKLCLLLLFGKSFKKNEGKKSNVKKRNKRKSVENIKKNESQTSHSGWKWKRNDYSARKNINRIRGAFKKLVSRTNYKNWFQLDAMALQNRHSKSSIKNCCRNRRKFSLLFESSAGRQKKRRFLEEHRIQSIEVSESRSNESFTKNSKYDYVYNLEVEGNNNYFANGILVHNCHIASFDKLFDFIEPKQIVLGFTATPVRKNKQKPLSLFFNEIVQGVSIGELIKQKYLAKPTYYGVPVDLSSVKMKMGEFDEAGQTKVYGENVVFEGLKENINKYAKGKKTIIFCPSIETTRKVASELNCMYVDSKMNNDDRKLIIKNYKSINGGVLANCGILTTGFDCADIECVVLYRATTSLPLYLQMIGRGSRTTETKKKFIILDFGRNIQRHGFWHDERQWTLHVPKKKKANKDDVYPVKDCPRCGAMVHARVMKCQECGYVWKKTEKERVFAELQELSYNEIQIKAKNATILQLEQIRLAKGYKVGWILNKFETEEQFNEYAKLRNYKPGWVNYQLKHYLK